jgi:hypothetical protein
MMVIPWQAMTRLKRSRLRQRQFVVLGKALNASA